MLPRAQRRNASVRGGDWHSDNPSGSWGSAARRRSCGANRRGNEGLFNGWPKRTTSSCPVRLPNSPS